MYQLFRIPVVTLSVLACSDKKYLAGLSRDNVIVPGTTKRSGILNFYKIHKLAVKKRPKIGTIGMLWIDKERKIKRICTDALLKKDKKGNYICGDGTGKCLVIKSGAIETNYCNPGFEATRCPMIDTLGSR